MEAWKAYYGEAVRDHRLNDSEDNQAAYHRAWCKTGKQLGRKEPKPVEPKPDDTAWLYE